MKGELMIMGLISFIIAVVNDITDPEETVPFPSNVTRECPASLLMLQGNTLLPF